MSTFAQKKRRVNAVRKKTKKRLLKRMRADATTTTTTTTTTDDALLDEFGSVGLRKRRAMYASERPTRHYDTSNITSTTCAHRVCVLNTPEQQRIAILQEIRVIQRSVENKRVKPKIVVFVADSKAAKEWATSLSKVSKCGFVHSSDPATLERNLGAFKSGKLSILMACDDPTTVSRLYQQRATITAVLGASPPLTNAAFLGRCTIASKGCISYDGHALSATFCLRTKIWKLAAPKILESLRKYQHVVVTSNFEPFCSS